MRYQVTVTHIVEAKDVDQAFRRVAKYHSDIVYHELQRLVKSPEVVVIDVTTREVQP